MDKQRDEGAINEYLQSLLRELNNRDVEETRRRLDEIVATLVGALDGIETLLFGGSVAKHTYCDGLSDVDALLVIASDIAGSQSPGEIRALVTDALRVGLGPDVRSVGAGNLAVTVEYHDGHEVQLLPAIRRGDGFLIADPTGTVWAGIRPRAFAEKLTAVNRDQGGIVVPVIKLAKALIGDYQDSRRLTGYHVESLAVEAFEQYSGPRSMGAALRHFFSVARERVLSPIVDSTGQSVNVDDHLGIAGSIERRSCADSLARTARRLAQSTTTAEWRAEFEG